jgi:Mrp family chromosome partitioning ATPase
VQRAIDILNDAKAEVIGVALNDLNGTLPYYYNYKYYRYRYRSQREDT